MVMYRAGAACVPHLLRCGRAKSKLKVRQKTQFQPSEKRTQQSASSFAVEARRCAVMLPLWDAGCWLCDALSLEILLSSSKACKFPEPWAKMVRCRNKKKIKFNVCQQRTGQMFRDWMAWTIMDRCFGSPPPPKSGMMRWRQRVVIVEPHQHPGPHRVTVAPAHHLRAACPCLGTLAPRDKGGTCAR